MHISVYKFTLYIKPKHSDKNNCLETTIYYYYIKLLFDSTSHTHGRSNTRKLA